MVGAMVGGAALAFYALIGFEDSVNVAEESEQPERDYPRALFAGLLIAGVDLPRSVDAGLDVVPTDDAGGVPRRRCWRSSRSDRCRCRPSCSRRSRCSRWPTAR